MSLFDGSYVQVLTVPYLELYLSRKAGRKLMAAKDVTYSLARQTPRPTVRTLTIGHLRSDQSDWWPIVFVLISREI